MCFLVYRNYFFDNVDGVTKVIPGYMGGTKTNPTYEEVCTGLTGHAELVEITYDSNLVSFKKLLEVFFKTHDPTTLNRQETILGLNTDQQFFIKIKMNLMLQKNLYQVLNHQMFFRIKLLQL